jgi:hypothetical protein
MSQKMTALIQKATDETNEYTQNPQRYVDSKVIGSGKLVIGKRLYKSDSREKPTEWYELFFVKDNGEVIDLSDVDPMEQVKCSKCKDEHDEEKSLIDGKVLCLVCQHTTDGENERKRVKETREREARELDEFKAALHAKREKPLAETTNAG